MPHFAGRLIRHFVARLRLYGALVLGIALYFMLPSVLDLATRLLVAWNVAIVCYLVMTGHAMWTATDASMRKRAQQTDEGRYTVLMLALFAVTTSLVAIVIELYNVRTQQGYDTAFHIGLSVATIVSAWTFIHVIFTEHYAHEFYIDRSGERPQPAEQGSGLKFPGESRPRYIDFLYFSFTIGVANQTADVSIEDRSMRILVLIQSVIAYFFNTIILALTINIAAGLLQG